MKLELIPPIPGYISVARAAKILGMAKASVYYKIYDQDAFNHVYKLPGADDSARPVLLMLESEVRSVAERERAQRGEGEAKERLRVWNQRVKVWGRAGGWASSEISTFGQPSLLLQGAYLQAHPQDPRPE
jgi:hypothetical protein